MILAIALLFIPPPVEQFQANCTAPTYATDMLVCGDPELKARDAEMGALLAQAGEAPVEGRAPLLEPQADWLKRRSLCAMKANGRQCTVQAYNERIAILREMLAPANQPTSRYNCTGRTVPGSASAAMRSNGTLAIYAGGELIGIAMRAPDTTDWLPYATLSGSIAKPIIRKAATITLRCRK